MICWMSGGSGPTMSMPLTGNSSLHLVEADLGLAARHQVADGFAGSESVSSFA